MAYRKGSQAPIYLFAYNSAAGTTNGKGVSGDLGNQTKYISLDGAAPTAAGGTLTEADATNMPGVLKYVPTVAESQADTISLHVKSSAANVAIPPVTVFTSVADAVLTRSGTAQTGSTSSTIKLDSGASATSNLYRGSLIYILAGTGAGQPAGVCTAYDGTTKIATVTPNWITTPDNTSYFALVNAGANSVTADANGFVTLASTGLDQVSVAQPSAAAASFTFRDMLVMVYRRFFGKSTYDKNGNTLKVFKDDGTTAATTQNIADSITATTIGTSA